MIASSAGSSASHSFS
jgi:hypothetical protein